MSLWMVLFENTSQKVPEINSNSFQKYFLTVWRTNQKIITFTTDIEPKDASNKGVSWKITNQIPNIIEELKKNDHILRIKIKGNQNITITATSLEFQSKKI